MIKLNFRFSVSFELYKTFLSFTWLHLPEALPLPALRICIFCLGITVGLHSPFWVMHGERTKI